MRSRRSSPVCTSCCDGCAQFLEPALQLEKLLLAVEASAVADERAVRTDDAMAGEHDRDAVAVHDRADRTRCPRTPHLARQRAVGRRLAVGDVRELTQHRTREL